MSSGTGDPTDRRRLSDREIAWITVEIAVALLLWIAVTQALGDHWHAPGWLVDVVSYGGGFGAAMAVAWWRIIRHGPGGPRRSERGRILSWGARITADGLDAGLLVGGLGGLVMGVLLLSQAAGDDRAAVWGGVFIAFAALQFGHYFHRRRRR